MRKKIVALLLSAAMIATMFPAGALAADEPGGGTAEEMQLVASYDMSHEGTALTDISGNGNDAELVGIEETDFAENETDATDTVLNFTGNTAKYVSLPDDIIHGEEFAVEAIFKTGTAANHWLWCLGSKSALWPNVKNYVFFNPMQPGGSIRTGIMDGSRELLMGTNSNAGSITADEYTKVRMEFADGELKLLVNGELTQTMSSGYFVQNILKDGTENGIGGYIGRSLYENDPGFIGTLTKFDVYSLTSDSAYAKDDLGITLPNKTNRNIKLPTAGYIHGGNITWTSDHPDIVDAEGNVTAPAEETIVNLTATAQYGSGTSSRTIPVTVYDKTVLVDFNFDTAEEDGSIVSENAKATGTYILQDSYDGKALYLDGTDSNWLNVTALDGTSILTGEQELTISCEIKLDRDGTNWAFYAAPSAEPATYAKEKYLAALTTRNDVTVQRWNNSNGRQPSITVGKVNDWVHMDVVCSTEDTVIYINGEEQGRVASTCDLPTMLKDVSVLQIGKANWVNGEFYKGWIDNFKVVNTALTQEELQPLTDRFLGKTTPADKDALAPAIEAGKAKQTEIADTVNDYTEASVTALADAITEAEALVSETIMLENQKKIDDAVAAITAAIEGLALKPADTKALEAAIEEADNVNKNHITDESVGKLDAAYKEATDLLATNPTIRQQDEVNTAAENLKTVIANLEKKPVTLTALKEAVAAAEVIKENVTVDKYPEAAVNAFNDALEAANALLAKEADLTIDDQDAVDAAVKAMNEAIENLDKKVLVDFNFDEEAADGGFASENAKATGTYSLKDSYDGKALYLDGSNTNWLNVTAPDGTSLMTGIKELTVSFELKADRPESNWPYYAAPSDATQVWQSEKYIGGVIKDNNGQYIFDGERYNSSNQGRPPQAWAEVGSDWVHIDVVYAADKTTLYVNGEEKAKVDSSVNIADMLGNSSVFYIGRANWGDNNEYSKAWIDNFRIVNKALTQEALQPLTDNFLAKNKPADKTALETAIIAADAKIAEINTDNYTEETVTALNNALKEANDLKEATVYIADQKVVDDTAKALNDAVKALTLKPADMKALKTVVSAANLIKATVTTDNYTKESVEAFTEALELGNLYVQTEDQFTIENQADIDALTATLTKAIEDLAKEDAKKDLDAIKLPAETTTDLTLPAKGTVKESKITWVSDNTKVIANDGKVTRPSKDTTVKLTATAEYRSMTATKEFTVKVLGSDEEAVEKVLVDFNFDADETGFTSENAKAEGTYTLVDGYDGKALYLDGSSTNYLKVTAPDGSSLLTGAKELTVSFEVKPDSTGPNWVFYAAPNDSTQVYESEKYIGSFTKNGNIDGERYNSNSQARPAQAWTAIGSDWVHIDIVYAETETILYVNGEEKARESSIVDIAQMLGNSSIFYIGRANWETGEYCKAWIDNYRIVNYAVTEEDIPELSKDFLSKTAKADKTELEKAIKAGDEKNKEISIYTEATAKALTDALKAAKDLMAAEVLVKDQSKVDAAAKALNDAIAGLKVKAADLTVLNASIKAAEDKLAEINVEDYTEASVKALNDALKAAKDMAAKEDLTGADQKDIDAAVKALDDAVKGLEENNPEPGDSVVDIFEDIYEGEWYIDAAQYVFDRGIMTGLTETIFGANVELSRAHFATILYRIEGEPEVTLDESFPDVEAGSFYEKAVAWASSEEVGVIKGYADGTFGPADILTREQMVVMMYRYLAFAGVEVELGDYSGFPDADNVSPFAEEAMKWAVGSEMIKGDNGMINPQGVSSRACCATVIMRFLETYGAEE